LQWWLWCRPCLTFRFCSSATDRFERSDIDEWEQGLLPEGLSHLRLLSSNDRPVLDGGQRQAAARPHRSSTRRAWVTIKRSCAKADPALASRHHHKDASFLSAFARARHRWHLGNLRVQLVCPRCRRDPPVDACRHGLISSCVREDFSTVACLVVSAGQAYSRLSFPPSPAMKWRSA
jgi:hypothetical protein